MRRTTVLGTLVISALLTLGIATPAAAAAGTVDYVAMGDSYSSGVGAAGQSGLCLRSPNGYPGLWAAANDPRSYRSVACGGATTDTLRATQLIGLSRGTDLVTVTIGGNDAGFAPTVISCTLVSDAACQAVVDDAAVVVREELPAKLDATYRAIKRHAPNARVFVLGYPILFDVNAPTCGFAGMSIPKRRAVNAANEELNTLIEERSRAAGLTYVDVTDEFAGHGICAAANWIHPLVLVPPTNSFHPTGSGYRYGYLAALSSALN
ncbi:SGNH/GDSL hydrolase family protein [Actinoplanes sp. NBRC 103695]|uniref:SGNH/GDSL hydrolase family protein n=1 Tax=Actinoplanes sp. NBRC 103695 TaxID=3032202 RepID=UPI0024A1AD83|nr:SGNH/GDSL hydrolase family protein [Actinoplanes sp. NBRC 103695]GLZ01708.1 lipase 1 [Actinoplanes sp. NBRC 103695]